MIDVMASCVQQQQQASGCAQWARAAAIRQKQAAANNQVRNGSGNNKQVAVCSEPRLHAQQYATIADSVRNHDRYLAWGSVLWQRGNATAHSANTLR